MNTVKEILDLRSEIDNKKNDIARLEGRRDSVKQELKKAGCRNMKEAKAKLARLNKSAKSYQKELDDKLKQASEEYGDLL